MYNATPLQMLHTETQDRAELELPTHLSARYQQMMLASMMQGGSTDPAVAAYQQMLSAQEERELLLLFFWCFRLSLAQRSRVLSERLRSLEESDCHSLPEFESLL